MTQIKASGAANDSKQPWPWHKLNTWDVYT